jgi:prevent-host-death family protein
MVDTDLAILQSLSFHLTEWYNSDIKAREADMPKMATSEARDKFTELINRAAYQGERTVIRRRGKGMAAIIPMEDFDLLEKVEDLIDSGLLKKARAEVRKKGTIPWEKVKTDAGR